MGIAWAIGAFVLILTPIVFIHELGHFVAARLSNIRVDEFGLGFPPRAVKLFERNGTIYSLNWIPLGGFVRPAGEDDPTVEGGLAASSKRARFFVLVAGAVANFIFAIAVFWLAFVIGPSAVAISEVSENSPAEAAGLQAEDIFVAINGLTIGSNGGILVDAIDENAGSEVDLLIRRGDEEILLTVVPRTPDQIPEDQGALGVMLGAGDDPSLKQGPVEALNSAVSESWNVIYLTVSVPRMLMQGEISAEEARPVGPVGISQIAGQAAQQTAATGDWFGILSFTAFISIALGFTNLLPIPALDGGRILFVLVEAVRGRRIEPEREGLVHLVGMALLLGLMLLITVQDIINPVLGG